MKKYSILILIALLVCLCICSCGKQLVDEDESSTTGVKPSESLTTAAEEEVTTEPATEKEPSLDDVWDSAKPGTDGNEDGWTPSYELPKSE